MTYYLQCPDCGDDLIPNQGMAVLNDGDFVEHSDDCSCPDCGPVWHEDQPHVTCSCGTTARVSVDDDHAYAVEVADE